MNVTDDVSAKFEKLGYNLIPVEIELWNPTEDRDHAPYGYMPSMLLPVTEDRLSWERVLRYCPDLISTQMESLGNEAQHFYLNSLSIHISMHVTHVGAHPDDLEDRIEGVLSELDPVSYGAVLAMRAGAR